MISNELMAVREEERNRLAVILSSIPDALLISANGEDDAPYDAGRGRIVRRR